MIVSIYFLDWFVNIIVKRGVDFASFWLPENWLEK
jgi:hypothetical protein